MKKLLTAFIAAFTISTICLAEEIPETGFIQETPVMGQEIGQEEDILEEDFPEDFSEASPISSDLEIEVTGIEEIDVIPEPLPNPISTVSVVDVLENHDVFTFRQWDDENDCISMMSSVLPCQVTVLLSDGRQVMAPVTGGWKLNKAGSCFENTASVPAGVTDSGLLSNIRIRYKTDPFMAGSLSFTGSRTEGKDTIFTIFSSGDEDAFFVYKDGGAGISTLKCSSDTSPVDRTASLVKITEPKSKLSDSGKYFCVSYNRSARNGGDCPIYLVPADGELYVEHAWYHTPDTNEFLCSECGIYYEQVYDFATGQRLEKQKTLEELNAEREAERIKASNEQRSKFQAKLANSNEKPKKAAWSSVKKNKRSVSLKWKKVSKATYYEIYWRTEKKEKFKKLKKTTKLSYTKKKLKKGKTYYFKVRAVNVFVGIKVYGKFSKAKKIKI